MTIGYFGNMIRVFSLLPIILFGFILDSRAQSLHDFLQSSYDTHPELLYQVQDALRQFDQSYGQAAEGFLPTLNYSWNESYTRRNAYVGDPPPSQAVPVGSTQKSRSSGYSLSLRQNLFSSFRDIYELRQFIDTSEALKLTYYANEQQFLLSAIDAYLNVIRRANVVRVREANYGSLKERLSIVHRLYEVGDTTELDLQQSTAQLYSARSQWERAKSDYEGAVADFRRYSGIEPQNLTWPEFPESLPNSIEDGERAVMQGNFEVIGLDMFRKVSRSAYNAARSRAGLSINFSIDYQDNKSVGGIRGRNSPLTLANRSDTTTGISATLPIYDPTRSSAIRSAYQSHLQAKSNYTRRSLDNLRLFRSQWAAFNSAEQQVKYLDQARKSAELSKENAIIQQQSGLRSIVEVLDEESRLVQAQVAYEDARYAHLISAYQLLLYTGRLTAENLGLQAQYDKRLVDYFRKQTVWGAVPAAYTVIYPE